jgi:hypothetical protein
MALEIDKDKLAYGGGIGLGLAGVLTHLGLRAVDQAKALGKQRQRYEGRVFDALGNTTVGQLNPRQQKALEYFGIDITDVDPATKLSELPTGKLTSEGKSISFIDELRGPQGYKAKVNKNDRAALVRQTLMNEFVVPVEQQVITNAQQQTDNKRATARVVSEQLHDGGAAPRRSDVRPQVQNPFGTPHNPEMPFDANTNRIVPPEPGQPPTFSQGRNMSWLNPGGMASLRQGAAGQTQPTSSLITNSSFLFPGQQSTTAQVRGSLPPAHPSFRRPPAVESAPGQEVAPPIVSEERVAPQRPELPTARSSGWTGAETPKQRQTEYDEALKQRRKANKVYVPGEGFRAKAGNIGRNMVREVVNAPTASKVMYGAGVALPIIGSVWANTQADKQADAIDTAVRPPVPQTKTQPNTSPEPKWKEPWHKEAINEIRAWPMLRGKSDAEITQFMKAKQGVHKYAYSANTWLQYYGK